MLLVLIVLILACVFGVCWAVLRGQVDLELGEKSWSWPLPNSPLLLRRIGQKIELPGWILIVGIPFTRKMHIWIRCPRRPLGDGTLPQAGHGYISGVWVTHVPHVPDRSDAITRIAQFLRFWDTRPEPDDSGPS
jgi:hypothetical protein